ncbi:hypothetical protein AMATHDRAFT_147100 [Amanita thiersii Skay4041]|uniref:F-box domain-containing protein n=1 Tax=Amanita thiersii Skay4041 TaxID=703135 RepID=A0A2A9NPM5_9AGAR|nr:hypothetical protein AMATHDRAFT_147100 [Amanita thiersii Skay4041]
MPAVKSALCYPHFAFFASALDKCFPHRFVKRAPCSIFKLPPDVLIDVIFLYLYVEDILALRRVSKAFFVLTHEPVIWKRFLLNMDIPLPHLRPSFKYTSDATDYEVEQIVTRALSLDDNWRSSRTRIRANKYIPLQHQVLDMVLLPGGKFLVASMKDAAGFRCYLTLFAMDHPNGHRAIARVPTISKAYFLQAKYVEWKGRKGIMIVYCRRRFQNYSRTGVDPSDYSHRTEIDPPIPFAYEVKCLHVDLERLEYLVDPHVPPVSSEFYQRRFTEAPPFTEVEFIESDYNVTNLTLFEFNRNPFFGFLQEEEKVVLVNPLTREMFIMSCVDHPDYPGYEHRIRAFRVLPGQKEILIVRTVTISATADLVLLEIYAAPQHHGLWRYQCTDRYTITGKVIASVHISDYGVPSTTGDQPTLQLSTGPPPPISLYFRTLNPNAILHHSILPSYLDYPKTLSRPARRVWFYDLAQVTLQTNHHVSPPYNLHILPGAYRAVVYSIREEDRKDTPGLVALRRYLNPEFTPKDYPRPSPVTLNSVLRKPRYTIPAAVYSSIELSVNAREQLAKNGISAIAWDESIGRLCIVPGNEQKIRVLDFSSVVQPDERLSRWVKAGTYFQRKDDPFKP